MDWLSPLFATVPPALFAAACAVGLLAGFVKGAVGFAMPMIMISGLASFLSPELALAGLVLPTLVTNARQALREGFAAAWSSVRTYRLYLGVGGAMLIASGQLVRNLDERALFLIIGMPIILFGFLQLTGYRPYIPQQRRRTAELGLGTISGLIGGISGVWGPPLVMYLTAVGTPKAEQTRTLGVAFGLGAVLLLLTHLQTGVLNAATIPFSAVLILPAMIGMHFGLRLHDRLEQDRFRVLTLVVLIVAGLNLIRRALM